MRSHLSIVAMAMIAVAVTGCSLPRGAALQSEIIGDRNGSDTATRNFAVVPVGSETIDALMQWPATGWHGHYHWPSAARGPNSSLIAPGDRISLVIWDSQPNSLLTNEAEKLVNLPNVKVTPSGTVFIPYVEEVLVRGLTEDAARMRIQEKLEVIVPDAQVQVSVEQGRRNSVDLISGVPKPGSFPLPGRNYTVLSLLAEGGGVAQNLRNPLVRLIRGGETYEMRSDALLSDANRNVRLRGGDQVMVVEDNRYFTALGATGTERLIYFEKETMTALDAMSVIGGLSDSRADPQGVLILRDYPASALRADTSGPSKRQVIFTIDLTSADGLFAARKFQINPSDTVLATESPVTAARTILGLLGAAIGINNQLQ